LLWRTIGAYDVVGPERVWDFTCESVGGQ